MNLKEKHMKIQEWCDKHESCSECPFYDGVHWCDDAPPYKLSEVEADMVLASIDQLESKNEVKESDNVDHPKHYTREKAMECIDEMLMIFGSQMVINFCILNAWKYRYRAADKNGAEDLEKSDWYLNKAKELMDKRD